MRYDCEYAQKSRRNSVELVVNHALFDYTEEKRRQLAEDARHMLEVERVVQKEEARLANAKLEGLTPESLLDQEQATNDRYLYKLFGKIGFSSRRSSQSNLPSIKSQEGGANKSSSQSLAGSVEEGPQEGRKPVLSSASSFTSARSTSQPELPSPRQEQSNLVPGSRISLVSASARAAAALKLLQPGRVPSARASTSTRTSTSGVVRSSTTPLSLSSHTTCAQHSVDVDESRPATPCRTPGLDLDGKQGSLSACFMPRITPRPSRAARDDPSHWEHRELSPEARRQAARGNRRASLTLPPHHSEDTPSPVLQQQQQYRRRSLTIMGRRSNTFKEAISDVLVL